ncbi:MAG: DUF4394 domain-containing protein [Mucilaginibacter polytrichastri]|nr:DUF4394 domain-containing protein [Mucilaginibacter polytrichastri]
MTHVLRPLLFLAMLFVVVASSCKKEDGGAMKRTTKAGKPAYNNAYALSLDGTTMYAFNTSTPEHTETVKLQTKSGEGVMFLTIDFRPATGKLYGLGFLSGSDMQHPVLNLYTIDPKTGVVNRISGNGVAVAQSSINVMSFDPLKDRIRFSSTDSLVHQLFLEADYHLNPAPVANAQNIPVKTAMLASAHTNSFNTAQGTTFYSYFSDGNLYQQNGGMLMKTGPVYAQKTGQKLMLNNLEISGLDNVAHTITAYTSGDNYLFTIDLATGAATEAGRFAYPARALAIEPEVYQIL